ncbi:hypothetical protein ACO1O0_002847 [Amphichorda felina]
MEQSSDSGYESVPSSPIRNQSRRVIFSNLPKITLHQLLTVVRGEGGLIGADIFNTSKLKGSGARTGSLEFVYPSSAEVYVDRRLPVGIEDENGDIHYPEVWLSPARVNTYHRGDSFLLQNGFTRALRATEFPAKAVWFCLNALGLRNIVDASYDTNKSILNVEFVSIFHASLAIRTLREGRFPFYTPDRHPLLDYNMSLVTARLDSTDSDVRVLPPAGLIAAFVPHDYLDRKFNRLPYNQKWPESFFPIMNMHGLQTRPRHDTMLETIQKYASFSRSSWSWQMAELLTSDHDTVLDTLSDPEWRDAWASFFQANTNKTENLLRWADYAAIAQHRRDMAAELGLAPGQVPSCANCRCRCGLSREMVPQVVQDFLDGKIEVQTE